MPTDIFSHALEGHSLQGDWVAAALGVDRVQVDLVGGAGLDAVDLEDGRRPDNSHVEPRHPVGQL